jgi:transcriptional regulator with XRE-family HTH domain
MTTTPLSIVPSNLRAPAHVDLHVGARIRTLRKLRGVSQDTLAKTLNLTFQQVQKYERGANRVSASKLYDIAVYLRVRPGYFFEGLTEPPIDVDQVEDPIQQLAMEPGGVELAQAFLICDRHRRQSIMNVAVTMAETMKPGPVAQREAA